MMTFEEFQLKFKGKMLVFMMDAWSTRRCSPSELGLIADQHALEAKRILKDMYDSLTQDFEKPTVRANGVNRVGNGKPT